MNASVAVFVPASRGVKSTVTSHVPSAGTCGAAVHPLLARTAYGTGESITNQSTENPASVWGALPLMNVTVREVGVQSACDPKSRASAPTS